MLTRIRPRSSSSSRKMNRYVACADRYSIISPTMNAVNGIFRGLIKIEKEIQYRFHLGWWSMGQIKSVRLMSHNQLTTTRIQKEKNNEMEGCLIMSASGNIDNVYVLGCRTDRAYRVLEHSIHRRTGIIGINMSLAMSNNIPTQAA